jgi:hypothetical protein
LRSANFDFFDDKTLTGTWRNGGFGKHGNHYLQFCVRLVNSLGALLPDKGCHVRKAAGELAAVIDRSFPLSDGAAAHAYAQTRGRIGRIILIP